MKFIEAIKNKWKHYLNKLGDENKKAFGDAPLDCCSLNQKENHGKGPSTGSFFCGKNSVCSDLLIE